MRLLDHGRRIAAARVVELHDVESAGTAQYRRHVALLHVLDGAHEHGGQAGGCAPAEIAALDRVWRVGKRGGGLVEFLAILDLLQRIFGPPPPYIDLVRRRLFRHADHDVRQQVFVFSSRLRGDRGEIIVVHFGLGHLHTAVDFAFAQPLNRDFAPDVFAVFG